MTGKPSALKDACSVWGGDARKPVDAKIENLTKENDLTPLGQHLLTDDNDQKNRESRSLALIAKKQELSLRIRELSFRLAHKDLVFSGDVSIRL